MLAGPVSTFTLRPKPPFRLDLTVRLLQRRPINRVEVWEDGRYWRVLPIAGDDRLVCVWQEGAADSPVLSVAVVGDAPAEAELLRLRATLALMLGAEVDTLPFFRRLANDPVLAGTARALTGIKPPRYPTTMECLVNVLTFQQISLAAALAIVGRLVDKLGRRLVHQGRLYLAFPSAVALAGASHEELTALGLSQYKARTVRLLAEQVVAGRLDLASYESLSSAEAQQQLTLLPGIGPWSASVLLLRGLGRLDVFPKGDSGIRRGLARLYGLPQPLDEAAERALVEPFAPYQGLFYLFVAATNLIAAGVLPDSAQTG